MNAHYQGDAFRVVRGASGARGSPAERLVCVFQCYLDDSGTSGLPVVTMAGFVAALNQWEALEPALDEILSRLDVEILHAKEFSDTKDAFKGWSKIKKRSLAEELFQAAHGKIYGVSMTVRKEKFKAEKIAKDTMHTTSAYGLCFSSIMFHIVTNPQLAPAVQQHGLSFLIESGNKNNAEIEQAFHAWSGRKHFKDILRSISFIPKRSCRAIQLADFFAYFSRRYMCDNDRFSGKLSLPMGPYLATVFKHVPIWQKGASDFKMNLVGNIEDMPDFNSDFWGPRNVPIVSRIK